MKPPLIAILLTVCLNAFWTSCQAGESSGTGANLPTNFVERGVLSPAEISSAIALAKQCGLAEAASVETYYFQPISLDWNYGIEVRGREVVSGRWISYVTVDICRHEAGPERKMKSLGKFWVAPGEVRTNDFATFVVSNRTIRVEMPRTFALATAVKVVDAFAARKIQYPDTFAPQRARLEQYDFSAPNKLTGPDQDGNYTITKGVNRGCEIKFTLEGEAVKIIKVSFFES